MVLVIKTIYMIQEFQEVCKNLNREQVGKISLFCCFFNMFFSGNSLFNVSCLAWSPLSIMLEDYNHVPVYK